MTEIQVFETEVNANEIRSRFKPDYRATTNKSC